VSARLVRLIAAVALVELALGLLSTAAVRPAGASLEVVGGWVEYRTGDGYFTIVNRTPRAVQVDAVTSPVATTVILHHGLLLAAGSGGGIAHLYCGDPPADPTEGFIAADFDTNPLAVPPRSSVVVAPGHGRLAFALPAPALRPGASVPIRLYLDDGEQLGVSLAAR
jgi:copper(I)-binding protein